MIRASLVDDEPLALKRLARLLEETGRVEIAGTSTDPVDALACLASHPPDALFLDIQMPGMNGFEMLGMLEPQPFTIFTTAFDQYALRAFEVNSIDYLLKPVEAAQLARALNKLERLHSGEQRPDLKAVVAQLAEALRSPQAQFLSRVASRIGERVQFIELAQVTHFFAEDKLTYAATPAKNYVVDHSISDLERKLDPSRWIRIHRATLLNIDYLQELDAWLGGRILARLKDPKRTELQVARDRVRPLRERLGLTA
jgi:two-component system LytT family response regulator